KNLPPCKFPDARRRRVVARLRGRDLHVVKFHNGIRAIDVSTRRAGSDRVRRAGAVVDGGAVQKSTEAEGGRGGDLELERVPDAGRQVAVDLAAGARVAGGCVAVL